jgi:hypothetical protein
MAGYSIGRSHFGRDLVVTKRCPLTRNVIASRLRALESNSEVLGIAHVNRGVETLVAINATAAQRNRGTTQPGKVTVQVHRQEPAQWLRANFNR